MIRYQMLPALLSVVSPDNMTSNVGKKADYINCSVKWVLKRLD